MTVRHWMILAGLLVVGIGILSLMPPAGSTVSEAPAAPPTSAPDPVLVPVTGPELAVIAPLAPGSDLAGWTVDTVEGVQGGAMSLMVHRAADRMRLQIALDDPSGPLAPARAGRYAVYYSGVESGDTHALVDALQAVIARHADVEPPPGLGRITLVEPVGGT